jgi:hypothetical protein
MIDYESMRFLFKQFNFESIPKRYCFGNYELQFEFTTWFLKLLGKISKVLIV